MADPDITEASRLTEAKLRAHLQPASDSALLGLLGACECTRLLTQGGMGVILEANDPELHRTVAIKLLPPELAASPLARERFVREAQALAALEHEHIMPVYAIEETGDLPYLVMPFIEGGSVENQWMAGQPLPL
jgi:eukaryotic-like serine/threonine-protein kinase